MMEWWLAKLSTKYIESVFLYYVYVGMNTIAHPVLLIMVLWLASRSNKTGTKIHILIIGLMKKWLNNVISFAFGHFLLIINKLCVTLHCPKRIDMRNQSNISEKILPRISKKTVLRRTEPFMRLKYLQKSLIRCTFAAR